MSTIRSLRPEPEEPHELHARAMDNLRFIRETMERAASFTAVPGWGIVVVGVTALVAAVIAGAQRNVDAWLGVWLGEALLALVVTGWAMDRKSRAVQMPLLSGPGRKFALSFAPPMLVGALLTLALYQRGLIELLPPLWLLMFGTAVVTGGAFSVRIVPVMGLAFLSLGAVGLVLPAAAGNALMAAGFGGLLLVFGVIIARRHGG